MQILLRHLPPGEIPASEDLYTSTDLDAHLAGLGEPPFSVVAIL